MTTNLSFAAFDVETANPQRGSICSMGVAIVRNGVRESTRSWLCRPPAAVSSFSPYNIRVHNITPAMVADQPTFAQRWPEVLDAVGDLPVVAHNADFDISNVTNACEFSGTAMPSWQYGCTFAWAKHQLRLSKYKLDVVAYALGVRLDNHHEAGSDAAAAADIAVGLAAMAGADTLADLARLTGIRLREVNPTTSAPAYR
jgi:DNA polymerase-3 subunit epsilon